MLGLGLAVARSPYGRTLKAIRDDDVAARAHGTNVFRYQTSVFALSGALAGLVGSLWAHYFAFITPGAFDLDQTIFIAAIVVLGGMGNMWGSVIAAFVLVSLPQVLRALDVGSDRSAQIQQVAYGLLLVLFMVFRPQGLLREPIGRRSHRRAGGSTHVGAHTRGSGVGGSVVAAAPPVGPATGRVALEAEHVTKRFGGVTALDDVSISLPAGTVTALIGPNGAGKTTLFNVLTGDVRADAGTVFHAGDDVTGQRPGPDRAARDRQNVPGRPSLRFDQRDRQRRGGRSRPGGGQPARPRPPSHLHVRDAGRRDRARPLGARHSRLRGVADVAVSELSYGEQKLVGLARLPRPNRP